MGRIGRSGWLVLVGIVGVAAGARASEAPLLVVVEVAPGVEVAPADVRQAVADELGMPVVGAREPAAAAALNVLLVGVDVRELRMSLRAGATPPVSRTIGTPSDRSGRLRAIGWLAGNLVRDQVGPIVAAREAEPSAAPPRPTTEPPALVEPARPDAAAPAAVIAGHPANGRDDLTHSPWTIMVGGGPTLQILLPRGEAPRLAGAGAVYQVEVQHQATPDGVLVGAALELGPGADEEALHYFGAAGLLGSRWGSRKWFIEGTVGVGLEALRGAVKTTTVTNNSQTGTVSETVVSVRPVPALYAPLHGAGGVRVSRLLDVIAQLGVHLSSEWQAGSYLSSTLGVRLRLP
jgi:hypothetical protein